MRPSRNDPCHCGSGRKYKKCHFVPDEQAAQAHSRRSSAQPGREGPPDRRPIPPEILAELERKTREESERRATFGSVRQIIHTDFQGYKIVAVGSTIYWSKKWRTFVDFLFYYIAKVLGADWGQAELAKAYADRHVILQWYQHVQEFKQRHVAGPNGLKTGNPDGPTRAYLALGYDLYVVGDSLLLQEKLVKRLKHRDQFQGARYELAVAATMIRAGFELTLEDEGDVTVKHPEFHARHRRTRETFAVEAKSRHRKGVLGRDGEPLSREVFRVGITDLLRKAIAKRGKLPYIIFVDTNMPPEIAWQEQETWLREVSQSIISVGHGYSELGVFEGGPFNALILTNWPDHYGLPGESLPAGIGYISEAMNPAIVVNDRTAYHDIERAVKQYGVIPTEFPV